MEAVPRLYMLSFELKVSPSSSDFMGPLQKYIANHYQEDPESYRKEIKEFETLRQAARKVPQDFTGCSVLKRYFSQLLLLQNRFPMTDDGPACVGFQWTDIYSASTFIITDIKYEQACILYNIGALHSQLGALDTRNNIEGMKMTCTHFQCAAWAFQHLRDTYPQPKGSDLSHDILTFMMNVMLAEAQECILEKSMLDNRKSSITAKVAMQVVDYYRAALGVLVSSSPSRSAMFDIIGSKMYRGWEKYIEFKMSYYTSISHYFMGNQCEEQQKMGERVSWFQSANEQLNAAIKIAKKMEDGDLNESIMFLSDVIGGKHSAAKKENDFVYHEKVLPLDNLPEVKGASLVKGISFDPTDIDVCGADIFARLVPMEAHSSSSIYSEEKAKLLRCMKAKIEEKDEELSTFMSSLQLDRSLLDEEVEQLPQELMEKCATMSVKPTAIPNLFQFMIELEATSAKVESDLTSCSNLLSGEERKEKEHQDIFGKRAPSMIIMDLKKECSKFDEAHKKAIDSNKFLKSVADSHVANLKLLSGPVEEIVKSLPSVNQVKSSETNESTYKTYQKLLDKVDEMQKQRQFLEEQLREALLNDDITKHIVASDNNADLQKLFEQQLKKHEPCLSYVEQNLSAQDNILQALTDANASFADVRKNLVSVKQERANAISTFIASFEAYEDLVDKTKKGLEFYQKLKGNVSRLFDRIKSVTKVQDEERMQRMNAQKPPGVAFHHLPADIKSSATPKLKDYLPFMTGNKLPPVSNFPSGVAPQLLTDPTVINSSNRVPVKPSEMKASAPAEAVIPQIPSKSNVQPGAAGSYMTQHSEGVPSQHAAAYASSRQYVSQTSITNTDSPGYAVKSQVFPGYSLPGAHAINPAPYTTPVAGVANNNVSYAAVPSSNTVHPLQSLPTPASIPAAQNVPFPYSAAQAGYTVDTSMQYTGYYNNSTLKVAQSTMSPIAATTIASVPSYHLTATSSAGHAQFSSQNYQPYSNTYSNMQVNGNIPAKPGGYGIQDNRLSSSYSSPQVDKQVAGKSAEFVAQSYQNQIAYPNMHTNVASKSADSPLLNNNLGPSNNYSINQPTAIPVNKPNMPQQYNAYNYSATGYNYSYLPAAAVTSAQAYAPIPTQVPPCNMSMPVASTYQTTNPAVPSSIPSYSVHPNYPAYSVPNNILPHSFCDPTHSQVPTLQATVSTTTSYNQPNNGFLQENEPHIQFQPLTPVLSHPEALKKDSVDSSINSSSSSTNLAKETVKTKNSEEDISLKGLDLAKQESKSSLDVSQIRELEKQIALSSKEKDSSNQKDSFDDPNVVAKFTADLEKFEKLVDGLNRKSLNGVIPLDQKWKDIAIAEEKDSKKMSISVARCYPLKNRVPDIMPYDSNRVKLQTCKDDYINASYLKDLLPTSPTYIITQAPLPTTYSDFWMMVWEQQVENIICLVPSLELKSHIYWPQEREKSMVTGSFELSLQSQKNSSCFSSRIISITHSKNKTSRVVVHLQFNEWQPSKLPTVEDLLSFVSEVLSYYHQQRSLQRPLLVHCNAGVGRSGAFCLISALAAEMNGGQGPKDVSQVAARMFQQRKFIIHDKDHLQFCYHAVFCYAHKMLKKKGIQVSFSSLDDLPAISSLSGSRDSLAEAVSALKTHASSSSFQLGNQSVGDKTQSINSTTLPSSASFHAEKNEDGPLDKDVEGVADIPEDNNMKEDLKETGCQIVESKSESCVTSVLDPNKFTLDNSGSSGKRRITKDMFTSCTSGLNTLKPENCDPLSQLDPLWSLKKM